MDGGAPSDDPKVIVQLIGGLGGIAAHEVARCAAPESAEQQVKEPASLLRSRCHQHGHLVLVGHLDLQIQSIRYGFDAK